MVNGSETKPLTQWAQDYTEDSSVTVRNVVVEVRLTAFFVYPNLDSLWL